MDHISKVYADKAPATALKTNQKSFFDFICRYSFENSLSAASPFVKSTFNVAGFDLLEEESYILDLGDAGQDDWLQMRVIFSFLYSVGGISRYSNMNQRLAAAMNSHLYLVNQSLLAFMKGLQVEMMKGKNRFSREITMSTSLGQNQGATFSTEAFLDGYQRFMAGISAKVQIFSQVELDLQEAAALNELLGIDEPVGMEDEGVTSSEEAQGVEGDIMDTLFIMHTLLRLRDHDFKIRDGTGALHDLEDLELDIVRGAMEAAFDETMDEHVYKASIIEKRVNQMMFSFYALFWRNYLGNLLPIILMSFLNFTHSMSVLDYMLELPFIATLRGVGQSDELALDSKDVTFHLKWFAPSEDEPQEAQGEEEVMRQAVDEGAGRGTSLENVFASYMDTFNGDIEEGLNSAEQSLQIYTDDVVNRKNALYSGFTRHLKGEVALQDQIVAGGTEPLAWAGNLLNILRTQIAQPYGLHEDRLTTYLTQGMQLTNSYILEETGVDMSNAPFIFGCLLHLLIKWYGKNGIPSHKLFLFNTWLKPLRPLSESLSVDRAPEGMEEDEEGVEEEEEGVEEEDGEEGVQDDWAEDGNMEKDGEKEEDEFFPELSKLMVNVVTRSGIPSFTRGLTLLPPQKQGMGPMQ